MRQDRRGHARDPRCLWLDPAGVEEVVAEAGFQQDGA